MGTLQEAAGGTAESVTGGDDAVISRGLRVALDKMSAASWEKHRTRDGQINDGGGGQRGSVRAVAWGLYVAVRQRYGHDVLCVDLQGADGLPRTRVLGLDGELYDEPVDAAREEPGDHDKGVVLSKRRQVGHESGGWRGKGRVCSGNHPGAGAKVVTDVETSGKTHRTQLSLCTKIC